MSESEVDDAGLALVRRGLIDLVAELGVTPSAVKVSAGAVSIEVEWRQRSAPAPETIGYLPEPAGHQPSRPGQEPETQELHEIRAETVGAFYRSPAPGEAPFVTEGDVVSPGQQVGILEAMKIMIPVEADCHGRVVKVLREDSAHVEYGEPLLAVEPIAA